MGSGNRHIAEKRYPDAVSITVVQDNVTAHRKAALYEVFEPERARNILRHIHFVQTPRHGSWLNIAEIELSVLNRVALKKRMKSKAVLQKQIQASSKKKTKRPFRSTGSSKQKMQEQNSKNYIRIPNLEDTLAGI